MILKIMASVFHHVKALPPSAPAGGPSLLVGGACGLHGDRAEPTGGWGLRRLWPGQASVPAALGAVPKTRQLPASDSHHLQQRHHQVQLPVCSSEDDGMTRVCTNYLMTLVAFPDI